MLSQQIVDLSRGLVRKYKTRDPFKIAEKLNIQIRYNKEFTKLKGMYVLVNEIPFVFLNARLDEHTTKIVLAHEIGHDRLHYELAVSDGFKEFSLYQMDTRPEYEANIFAAEMLIDSDRVLEMIYEQRDVEEIAKILNSDVNLVSLKVSSLVKQGYDLRLQDYRSDFLK